MSVMVDKKQRIAQQQLKSNCRAGNKNRCVLRRFHFYLGIVFTFNFLLIVITGFLVRHQQKFGLENVTVDRKWLPAGYRPKDPDTAVRGDIVITDLHSGRIFGPQGGLVIDSAAIAWLLMMASGYAMQLVPRRRSRQQT